MDTQTTRSPAAPEERTIVALVKDENRFEAVVAPAPPNAVGTHELRYLWNRSPFISRVFQRGTLDTLLNSVRALQDELIIRGWRRLEPQRAWAGRPADWIRAQSV